MPSSIQVKHPNKNLKITFTEEDHSYIDSYRKKYMSVTTLVNKAFPQFDVDGNAKRKAAKLGIDPEELKHQWEVNKIQSQINGTRCHEFAEHFLLEGTEFHTAKDPNELIKFNNIKKLLTNIKIKWPIKNIECEKVVFSPNLLLAGSIDVLFQLKNNQYIIGDYKFLKEDLKETGFNNQTSHLFFMNNIQDCNLQHYNLQLKIYEILLKLEGYIPEDSKVSRVLFVWNGKQFSLKKLEDIPEAWKLIAYKAYLK